MTKAYAEHKAALLAKEHNHYRKVGYTAAVKDYRTALDNLCHVAKRTDIEIAYMFSKAGYITIC